MEFQENVEALIRRRYSCRDYGSQTVDAEVLDELIRFGHGVASPFGSRVRFVALDASVVSGGSKIFGGTYGFIKNAPSFIAGILDRDEPSWFEDFGYVFEALILKATERELNTCWLGGTFHRGKLASQLALKNHEIIPCIAPVGHSAPCKRAVSSAIRMSAQAHKRKTFDQLFLGADGRTALSEAQAGRHRLPLEMVRLAPSASNQQPWRVSVVDPVFRFFLQRTRGFALLSSVDLQRIDMGIAMCHFELGMGSLGAFGSWKRPDGSPPPQARLEEIATFVTGA